MAWTLVDSDAIAFADGNGGHVFDLGSAPQVGDIDVLFVNSDTVVSTPDGWTLPAGASQVNNQGAYAFYRIAIGGEGSTVTITTAGNFNAVAGWSRWRGGAGFELAVGAQINATTGGVTPAISTGELPTSGMLVIAGALLHRLADPPPTDPVWSEGYTGLTEAAQGTGTSGCVQFIGYRTDAGPDAESPSCTWTGGAFDRYAIALAFTPASEDPDARSGSVRMTLGAPAAAGIVPPPANPIEAENRLTGTPKATWDITGAGDPTIQGFATQMSVDRGDTIDFKIHSPSAWSMDIYRLGYYGGDGARLVDTVPGTITTQPTGTVDDITLMADCSNWTVSASWTVPSDATPGIYIARPRHHDTSGASHIPFIVRDPDRRAAVLVVTADSTWQAYNHAGADPADPLAGRSLYGVGTSSGFTFNTGQRCRAVSYNRPWVTRAHLPQTWLFNAEYPALRWLERNGYDVDYASCADIDADPTLLTGRSVVIVHGHSEYWSAEMRDALVAARDAGVHLLILAGNEIFWRIRWDASRRTYACWKDSLDGALNPTGLYSGTWQDTRAFNPDRRAPQALTGQFFKVNGIYQSSLTVPDTYAAHPVWRDTTVATLTAGQSRSYPNLVGFETDEDRDHPDRPATWIRLSETQMTGLVDLISDENGADYTGDGDATHHLGAYRAASGAVVFGAGTVQLAWGLDAVHDRTATPEQTDIQQMVMNLLADLGVQCPDTSRQATLVKPTPVSLDDYGFQVDIDGSATLLAGAQLAPHGAKGALAAPAVPLGSIHAVGGGKGSAAVVIAVTGAAAAAAGRKQASGGVVLASSAVLAARGAVPQAAALAPARLTSAVSPIVTMRGGTA